MVAVLSLIGWVYLVVFHGGFWRTDQRLPRSAPYRPGMAPAQQWPSVTAVVPARNEAAVLPRTLPTLVGQDSVLVVPIPESTFTEPLRWQAETEEPSSLVGGYFMGPAWNGHVYIDGNGLTTSEQYLNQLWEQSSGQLTGTQPVGLVPDAVQMHAQIVQLHPAAVVAVTGVRTELGQYLISVLGKPTVISGSVLGWRM